MTMVRLQQVLG